MSEWDNEGKREVKIKVIKVRKVVKVVNEGKIKRLKDTKMKR